MGKMCACVPSKSTGSSHSQVRRPQLRYAAAGGPGPPAAPTPPVALCTAEIVLLAALALGGRLLAALPLGSTLLLLLARPGMTPERSSCMDRRLACSAAAYAE